MRRPADPVRLPEPPPRASPRTKPRTPPRAPGAFLDAFALAAVIAGPALRLMSLAGALLFAALMYRLGAVADGDGARAWSVALTALVALGLFELPPRARRTHPARPVAVGAGGRLTVDGRPAAFAARHAASIVVLVAATSLALLATSLARGGEASVLHCALAALGLLLCRAFLWLGERVAPWRTEGGANGGGHGTV